MNLNLKKKKRSHMHPTTGGKTENQTLYNEFRW